MIQKQYLKSGLFIFCITAIVVSATVVFSIAKQDSVVIMQPEFLPN